MGIGIFLGLFFCGVIYLYTQTKDRWNWKKLWRIMFYVITTPIAIGLIIWGGLFLYSIYEEMPKLVTSYKGVKLGESLNDVSFKLGKFEEFDEWVINYETEKLNKLEKNTQEYGNKFKEVHDLIVQKQENKLKNKGNDGDYIEPSIRLIIKIVDNKVIHIDYLCEDHDYSSVNSIGCKSSGDEILDKFSNEVRILCSSDKDNSERVYDTLKYGVRYFLKRNVVTSIVITEPKTLESYIGNHWVKCD